MRTFIFTKGIEENGKIILTIVGMLHSNMYPSSELIQGGKYYGCNCYEISDGSCHIEIGTFKPC